MKGTSGGATVGSDIPRALPAVPPDCPAELVAKMGADSLAKVERRWPKRHHQLGPCLVWRDGEARGPDAEKGPYGRIYDPALRSGTMLTSWSGGAVSGPFPQAWTSSTCAS